MDKKTPKYRITNFILKNVHIKLYNIHKQIVTYKCIIHIFIYNADEIFTFFNIIQIFTNLMYTKAPI